MSPWLPNQSVEDILRSSDRLGAAPQRIRTAGAEGSCATAQMVLAIISNSPDLPLNVKSAITNIRARPPFETAPWRVNARVSPDAGHCYGAAWPLPRRMLPRLAMGPFTGRTCIQTLGKAV